ncbi:MAG TPA: Maf family protein [Oligoflexia bacterium]|nr:Maf family protein [Oligoflexia bacterium]
MQLILASGSPRRQQMLRDLSLDFEVDIPRIIEKRLRGEPADIYVKRLALDKARTVSEKRGLFGRSSLDWCVLAADTVVIQDRQVFEKPKNHADAVRMLKKLSGRTHDVLTGYCWLGAFRGKCREVLASVRTKVTFAPRNSEFWEWYVSTGEPMDKAGAYAAQGIGVSFIEKVSGSYANVVGLPLSQAIDTFEKNFGASVHECFRKAR